MAKVRKVIDGRWLIGDVQTEDVEDDAITVDKVRARSIPVTVLAGNVAATTPANPELVGGRLMGIWPTTQDQMLESVELHADGSITVTLAAAATADNVFTVTALAV